MLDIRTLSSDNLHRAQLRRPGHQTSKFSKQVKPADLTLPMQAIAKMNEDRYDQDVSILQSIAAFIFFGVPHQGMAVGSLVPLMGDQPNRALLESLGRNSDLLKRLQRDFDRAFGTEVPKVVSYFETITSPTAIKVSTWLS